MASPSPNSSPTPKSRWSRMGGVVRRASSVLVVTRPSTPSIASSERDTDSTSIKGINTTPAALSPPNPSQTTTTPSPIAESPARERAATQEETMPVGPSPLAQETVAASPETLPPAELVQTPVQEYTPPPLIDSTAAAGPGAFTDDLDNIPQPQTIVDPSLHQQESTDGHEPITLAQPIVPQEAEPEASQAEPISELVAEPVPEPSTPEPTTPPPVLGAARSYFDIPIQEEPLEDPELSARPEDAFQRSLEPDVFGGEPEPITETAVHVDEPVVVAEEPVEAAEEPVEAVEEPMEIREVVAEVAPSMPTPAHVPTALPSTAVVYPMPSYDLNSGQEVWGGVPHQVGNESKPIANGNANTRSRVSSIRMPLEDPFADPVAPRITVSHAEPTLSYLPVLDHQQGPNESRNGTPGITLMPLPPVHEVIPSKSLRGFPSTQSLKGSSRGHFETDERRPLLSQPGSPKNTSYLQPSSASHNVANLSPQSGVPNSSVWPVHPVDHGPRLHDLGWIEYQLPDGTVYYVHPTRRVTTDIDLREDKKLDAITVYFENHKDSGGAPAGMEMWLQNAELTKRGFAPARVWVDHRARIVSLDKLPQNGDASKAKKPAEDDQLDIEYRYWSFMEAHPAHTSLPPHARIEAMDVLTWAWTDRLLPSHRTIPAPFTQEECQELMSLLRSFGDQGDFGLQTVVHTRIVSRILLRVAHWRQQYFRPNKALPVDAGRSDLRLPASRRPFRRALVDFMISCLCLGIPYIFFDRARHSRMDEESGLRNPAPMLVVGACTCLIAAIVLSASVTFLSLPGLDNIARVAGFVAILFASFSMASTVVALFRYKADLESTVSHVGGEGLMMLSRRSIVMSLPLVFLAYAIIGFVTGVVLYSFRGVTTTDPLVSQHPFDDYTRWTVVGVLGGLAGMLTTSLLLLRR